MCAPAPGHEHDLSASAQTVDGEKHLVPRKISALPRDLFEVARARAKHDVDHLIFRSDLLRHVPPVEKRNALLRGESCIVGATGWSRVKAKGDVR